jgi:molybdopterin molybdotransferase
MLGQINNCLMLGLPGNPVSVMVTFYIFARAVLQTLYSMIPGLPRGMLVPLAAKETKEKHLRSFPRASLKKVNGVLHAVPFGDQSSNLITSLTSSDGLLDLPMGETDFAAGSMVRFYTYESFTLS